MVKKTARAGSGARSSRAPKRKTPVPKRKTPAPKRKSGISSHWFSFLIGLLLGGGVTLFVVHTPDFGSKQVDRIIGLVEPPGDDEPGELIFRFDDLLKNSKVPTDQDKYRQEGPPPIEQPQVFHIQVASFQRENDAEQLRARLILQDMPNPSTARVELDNGAWYRVTVGPIESADAAKQVMERLRQKNLSAMWIKRS